MNNLNVSLATSENETGEKLQLYIQSDYIYITTKIYANTETK